MKLKTKTADDILQRGLDALERELGPVDMIRFLQMYNKGRGDYTKERQEWADNVDMETLLTEIQQMREEKPR